MRADLWGLYENALKMDREQLLQLLLKLLNDHDETLSMLSETGRASQEMSVQYAQMRDRLAGCEKENDLLKKENLKLTEQLALRKRDLFGRSTERSSETDCLDLSEDQTGDPLGEDAPEIPRGPEQSQEQSCHHDDGHKKTASASGRGGRKKPDFSALPVKTEFILDIEKLNDEYGEGNWRIYGWESHREYASIPCARYLKETFTPILSVGLEHRMVRIHRDDVLLPGSYASSSMVSQVMYDKFVLSLPTYRIEQDLLRNGMFLSRQTMSNRMIRFSLDLFGPVYDRMADFLRADGYSQRDETTLKVIHDGRKAGSVSYMWVHTTSELSCGHPITVFGYELTRGTEHLRDFYLRKGYRGFLTSDAYISYDVLEKEADGSIISTACFMHCRRRFVQAILLPLRNLPDGKAFEELPEVKARMLIDEIYAAETPLKTLSPQERLEKRNSVVRPKVDSFFEYIHSLDTGDPALGDRMKDAVSYALNHEQKLRRFLDDPYVPRDNGNTERKIRTMAIGRGNWLFCNTVTGAEAMAVIYTMTETAKANGAHPYYYLKYLLDQMPGHMDDTDMGFLDDMMPWSEAYMQYEVRQRATDLRFYTDQEPPVAPKTPKKRKSASEPVLPDQKN